MKKLLLILCLLVTRSSFAQVTLDSSDVVFAGEYLPYHNAANTFSVSYNQTGANHTWDYSTLTSASAFTDTFIATLNAPATMLLFFLFSSNLASPDQTNAGTWRFYRKNATKFQQPGTATDVSGAPEPVLYSSPDVIYRFPIQFGNSDSCAYHYSLPTGGLGFGIRENRKRLNNVDGWGTLKIPNKTFDNVLRIHSKLYITDSISLDSLGTSFNTTLRTQHEYKFLAKGYDWPVLTITTTELFGFQIVNSVVYRDMPAVIQPNGIETSDLESTQIIPNPFNNMLTLHNSFTNCEIEIYNMLGEKVFSGLKQNIEYQINTEQLAAGNYLITLHQDAYKQTTLISKPAK